MREHMDINERNVRLDELQRFTAAMREQTDLSKLDKRSPAEAFAEVLNNLCVYAAKRVSELF